ncbi:MAG: amidohydrolase [Micrococcales bacterium]|nr:amidohydrolase [Micrococcales bacterium]
MVLPKIGAKIVGTPKEMRSQMDYNQLKTQANSKQANLVEIRRDLHKIPEFGLDLPNTLARVLKEVDGLGEITLGTGMTAAAVLIKGGQPGPTVLLRADMDALAVDEDTNLDFASTNGYMHACGHDLHMAMGIGAVQLIAENKEHLKGDVVMFFQPGEEGHDGAGVMLSQNMHLVSGSKPIAAFGLHVFSLPEPGLFLTKPGTLMASAGDVIVTLRGRGGHGSMPWTAVDPITGLVEILSSIQSYIIKHFDALDPIVLNVGWIKAGNDHTTNIVPETASFGATVRSFSKQGYEDTRNKIPAFIKSMAEAFGLEAEVEFSPATKVLINDPSAVDRVERLTKSMYGEERYVTMAQPIPGGEDMASILEEIPGAFVFLGAAFPGIAAQDRQSNHSNKAKFDDSVLADGAALLAALAFDTLEEAARE